MRIRHINRQLLVTACRADLLFFVSLEANWVINDKRASGEHLPSRAAEPKLRLAQLCTQSGFTLLWVLTCECAAQVLVQLYFLVVNEILGLVIYLQLQKVEIGSSLPELSFWQKHWCSESEIWNHWSYLELLNSCPASCRAALGAHTASGESAGGGRMAAWCSSLGPPLCSVCWGYSSCRSTLQT